MLLVPDFDKITRDLELHTLVQRDLPQTFFPDTFVKIGDRRVQCPQSAVPICAAGLSVARAVRRQAPIHRPGAA